MKSGEGDDPFAEFGDNEDNADDAVPDEQAADAGEETIEPDTSDDTPETTENSLSTPRARVPYALARDSVKEDRDPVMFHLREQTQQAESETLVDVEQLLGDDVYTTDLREAALLVAFEQPEAIAEKLREWGYDAESL